MKIPILIWLVLSGSAFAQSAAADQTGGWNNGRGWLKWGEIAKTYFVLGFTEANNLAGGKSRETFSCGSATVGETVKGVDQFYLEPANAQIPVWQAPLVFCMKVKGASSGEVETTIARLRKILADGH